MGSEVSKGYILVAGHICIDLIPELTSRAASMSQLLPPGQLVNVGPAVTATGGAVANTGLALHRLGLPVRLAGKVGKDSFGEMILAILRAQGTGLAESMIVDGASHTSYTVVISPPGLDRVFLHHPGANDTFVAADVPADRLAGARIVHFGYPPLMARIYRDGGREMASLFDAARRAGAMTSLDMSKPDPSSESGCADWRTWMAKVLPHVDVFQPSFDELAFMLGEKEEPTLDALRKLSGEVLRMGAAVAAIKLGERGLYVRTTSEVARLDGLRRAGVKDVAAWTGRELLAPCCKANVVGTTGSGDCTIAGFLAALFEGRGPEETLAFATAVGACSVEAPDATSGVPSAAKVRERLAKGWERSNVMPALGNWRESRTSGVFTLS